MQRKRFFQAGAALVVATATTWAATVANVSEWIDQGWTQAQRSTWDTMSQGSRLLPLAWFRALEQPDSALPFLARGHSERFRYLTPPGADPAPLPVGFAIDIQNDTAFSTSLSRLRWRAGQSNQEPWVGMNCAACHTAELGFGQKKLRIDGGPTMADFQGYITSLNQALGQTRDKPAKWDRFAAKVLDGDDTPANRQALKGALDTLYKWQVKSEQANHTDLRYGYARLDAFGHIYNKILLRTEGKQQPVNPSDAPVSYPFLWNIHQHDKVQWNGMALNIPVGSAIDIGALGRNVGEAIGVFADLTVLPFGPAINGYPNSARIENLVTLEKQITLLKPPNWPAAFPAIDANKWETGKALFSRGANSCIACHQVLARDDLASPIRAKMSPLSGSNPIGTDPWMACNAYNYQARTGKMVGTPRLFFAGSSMGYGKDAAVSDLLGTAATGAIYANRKQIGDVAGDPRTTFLPANVFDIQRDMALPKLIAASAFSLSQAAADRTKADRLKACMETNNDVLAYKGRPLTGVWATAPFLHNGSVPTLYDLLLPEQQRPTMFKLGTREFDPQRVGFVNDQSNAAFQSARTAQENSFVFRVRDASGVIIPGNSNLGHDYGNAQFTEEQRWALVEYMKAVGAKRVGDRIVP